MRIKIHILTVLTFLTSCYGSSQNRVVVNIPTADSESEYIWRTIQDIKFFEGKNYQISLPQGSLINDLKVKSKLGNLTNEDYERLKVFVQDSVYDEADYQKGYQKIEDELEQINSMINEISQSNFKWNFKEFKTYQVNLTLYGPGGSYNPDEGSVLIFTTTNGRFKNYDNPANTIIHEITHIGIEEAIVNKYRVSHALKERIVDTFVFLNFGKYLPEYRIQDMGDKRTDQYLKTKEDLKDLDHFVKRITKEN
ncbi:hypothetical protein [Flagellimonas sp. CMM7]|uniref:hypothetical protein n=1 Tax=Flagellimonas sp. CMM7 TaxID=2654676 RepID=UPI001969D8E9|nr:hypothetical protein [Flagellimonas sp. CMM7]UII78478.1 hypothetical protein LV704_12485 [Flagellimonas sp. CMM7]